MTNQQKRFNEIIQRNQHKEEVLAFIGLGSMHDLSRLDAYSDIDFFIIVKSQGDKKNYMEDISWLDVHPIIFSYIETRDGLKVIYEDGILLEFAVLTMEELKNITVPEGTIYYKKEDILDNDLKPKIKTVYKVDFNKAISNCLSNLYVGLLREHRGEHVAAFLMIQVYVTSNLLKILDQNQDDPFVVERRIEKRLDLDYEDLYPGIQLNKSAVSKILNYLEPCTSSYQAIISKIKDML